MKLVVDKKRAVGQDGDPFMLGRPKGDARKRDQTKEIQRQRNLCGRTAEDMARL